MAFLIFGGIFFRPGAACRAQNWSPRTLHWDTSRRGCPLLDRRGVRPPHLPVGQTPSGGGPSSQPQSACAANPGPRPAAHRPGRRPRRLRPPPPAGARRGPRRRPARPLERLRRRRRHPRRGQGAGRQGVRQAGRYAGPGRCLGHGVAAGEEGLCSGPPLSPEVSEGCTGTSETPWMGGGSDHPLVGVGGGTSTSQVEGVQPPNTTPGLPVPAFPSSQV